MTINYRCASTVLTAWTVLHRRTTTAVATARAVEALAQQGRARRTVRQWLLAAARQVMAQWPSSPSKEVHELKKELATVQQRVNNLKAGDAPLQQEAVACRDALATAEKTAEVAKLEEAKSSLEFQAYMESMDKRRVQVEGNLCEALRENCRLGRQLASALEARAAREKRLAASVESAEALRSQMNAAEGQYMAAMATLCSEALRLREQLGREAQLRTSTSQLSEWEQKV